MFVSDALDRKGTDVITTSPEASVVDATRILKGRGIGVLVALDGAGRLAGIVSERDVVHGIAMHGDKTLHMTVRDLMTDDVVTCRRDTTVNEALKLMVDHAFRHLPVVEDDELKGLVSVSDIVKLRIQDLQRQIAGSTIYQDHH